MEEIDAAYAQLTQDLAVYEFTMKKIQIVVDDDLDEFLKTF